MNVSRRSECCKSYVKFYLCNILTKDWKRDIQSWKNSLLQSEFRNSAMDRDCWDNLQSSDYTKKVHSTHQCYFIIYVYDCISEKSND